MARWVWTPKMSGDVVSTMPDGSEIALRYRDGWQVRFGARTEPWYDCGAGLFGDAAALSAPVRKWLETCANEADVRVVLGVTS